MNREFGMVEDYDLVPVRSVYDYQLEGLLHVPNINDVMVTSGFDSSLMFFTDCSKGGAGNGFGVYHSVGPAFVLSANFVALIQTRTRRPDGRYLILTDSMSF
jgi:hypothetical protein